MRAGLRVLRHLAAWKWRLLLFYVALLGLSYLVRWQRSDKPIPPNLTVLTVPAIEADRPTAQTIRIAFQDLNRERGNDSVVVLLHGSPGSHHDFEKLSATLVPDHRVIIPDLPGFGASSPDLPDYSNRAHAHYVLEMLDGLGVTRAHFVGYSMGGGVALNIADIAPDRVASLTMLSAIGGQEFELLGDYYLNHTIHGSQLAFLWVLNSATPHFGFFDGSALDHSYARNFYDTDQRPLRRILSEYAGPMLVIHGDRDVMVPVEAARETFRLVPQSELNIFPGENHFYLFQNPMAQAVAAHDFLARVDGGRAITRAQADPRRQELADVPFNAAAVIPKASGPTALLFFGLLALATLISEDLTCVWAGVLAAEGRVSFLFATLACLFGIVVGDILLFLAGRFIGRPALRHAPLRWFVSEADVQRSSAWFRRRGLAAISVSRFLPGTRLPTYFAAGLLDTSFLKFTVYFLLAATAWTPILVGVALLSGRKFIESALMTNHLFLRVALAAVLVLIVVRLLLRLATFRGRRLLLARWRRMTHWEFWPPWMFYPPVALYIAYLGLKHRCLTLFTCANPAIDEGGFIGESKSAILSGLGQHPAARQFIAAWFLLRKELSLDARIGLALEFMRERGLNYPVVLKPNAGERGAGVAVIRSELELKTYLSSASSDDIIIQEHVNGLEFGIFYYRFPRQAQGDIFSITKKLFPSVVGDGESTLETLILKDARAVCMWRSYFDAQRDRLFDVPHSGEEIRLIEIGTHCRGSIFLDGIDIKSNELRKAIDQLARGYDGFYFGRFDIRTPSLTEFQQGRNFKVVELNGVTSEATNIYDPGNSLTTAYRVLFEQWRLAFEIGAQNFASGAAKPASLRRLAALLVARWRKKSERSGANSRLLAVDSNPTSDFAGEM